MLLMKKNSFFWPAKAWVLTSKRVNILENSVRQDENKGESKWCLTVHRFSVQISASCVNDK